MVEFTTDISKGRNFEYAGCDLKVDYLNSVCRQYQRNQRGRGREVERGEASERQWEHDRVDEATKTHISYSIFKSDMMHKWPRAINNKSRTRAEEKVSRETE